MSKKIIALTLISGFLLTQDLQSQVTIGSGKPAVSGALLDLKEEDSATGGETAKRGLGLPRVNLSKINHLFPMFGSLGEETNGYDTNKTNIDKQHTGLVVYNLTTDLNEGLCPGVYVWQEDIWIRLPEPCPAALNLENSPNSYIVAPNGGSVEIPCGKPYLVAQNRSDLTSINLTDKVTLEFLWQDTQNLIDKIELTTENKGPYSKFKVTTKSGTGNALVAIRMGPTGTSADPIVWSWHIWVTDYDPANSGTVYSHNNGEKDYIFMDRNLGATITSKTDRGVIGLTYQWGRKDPFSSTGYFSPETGFRNLYSLDNTPLTEVDQENAGTIGTGIKHELATAALSGASNNLSRSVQNPMTFFYGVYEETYKALDWFTINDDNAIGNNELWGASGAKSDFDPCPEGWRVPAYSTSRSPWKNFEGVENWGGYPSNYVKRDATGNGANFIANGSVFTELGFYPFSNYRRPRQFVIGGPVGSSGGLGTGGAFLDTNFIGDSDRETLMWTANSNASTAEAKGLALNMYSTPMADLDSRIQNKSRATGGYVRCVKAD